MDLVGAGSRGFRSASVFGWLKPMDALRLLHSDRAPSMNKSYGRPSPMVSGLIASVFVLLG